MKKTLMHFRIGMSLLLLAAMVHPAKSQTTVLAENFSGFTAGNHTTPSTSDISQSLDLKTAVKGWTGSYIYSAGGEVKIGTSTQNGWIETPSVDLSGGGGIFRLTFDICRWPGDATQVEILLDGVSLAPPITPGDVFEKVEREISGGTSSSKIRIASLAKRFFLDNIMVVSGNTTGISEYRDLFKGVSIKTIPGFRGFEIQGTGFFEYVTVYSITGSKIITIKSSGSESVTVESSNLRPGVYLVVLSNGITKVVLKVVII